jgi:hypothetical protein
VIDGGTDAGVMQLIGRARAASGGRFPLIGVAAEGTVMVPGAGTSSPDATELEPNHTLSSWFRARSGRTRHGGWRTSPGRRGPTVLGHAIAEARAGNGDDNRGWPPLPSRRPSTAAETSG